MSNNDAGRFTLELAETAAVAHPDAKRRLGTLVSVVDTDQVVEYDELGVRTSCF